MQQLPELVVAWHPELAGPQDVGGCEIHQLVVIRPLELLQEAGVIVQDQRAGVGRAEAVEHIAQVELPGDPLGLGPGDLGKSVLADELVGGGRPELVAVSDQ